MRTAVRLWILLSALLVSSGWLLSAGHALNRTGYGIVFALAAGAWFFWRRTRPGPPPERAVHPWHKLRRRFQHPLPRLFLALALLSLLAGILYPPHNGDSNSYRIPRVFCWLAAAQWHWIHTRDLRMNIAGTGFEWLSAPLILFTRYDRGLFLINWISFLLLPVLIYSVFIQLGVRRSVAWWWMWLLSSGWCYVWQAQDTDNDSFAVIYALASVDFALRARKSQRVTDWWLALLAAGLLTGAKQTCIPLVLVSVIALWPGWRTLLNRPWATLLVLTATLLVSALPVTFFNLRHTGNWMGTVNEPFGWSNVVLDSPFWGIIGNAFCLAAQNLKPPIFPLDKGWNQAMQHFVHTPFGSHFSSFENFGFLEQSAASSQSGIGLGVCLVLLLSVGRAARLKPAGRPAPARPPDGIIRLLWLAPWVALLAFMAKVGSYENARQLAPFYVFFFPVFLQAPGHARVVRERWWRRLTGAVLAITVVMVVVSRATPLFPAQTLFGWLHKKHPESSSWAHVLASFSSANDVQIQRAGFAAELPPEEKVIGYYSLANCGADPGWWQPLGIRSVERILPGDPREYAVAKQIHYIIVSEDVLAITHQSLADWLQQYDAELVSQIVFNLRWGVPPVHLYLTRLRPPAPAAVFRAPPDLRV